MNKIWLKYIFSAAALTAQLCAAYAYPTKPITVMVGYGAGGGTDAVVRSLTKPLGDILGVTILVQNVPGAGGGVAAKKVANAPADGYTILATTSSTFSLEPQAKKTAYSNEEFIHIATISQFQGAMFAKADKPYNNLQELIALAKKENRPIKYASFFLVDKLLMGYIGKKEGVKMIPVPVKGGNGAVQAALAGDVDLAYSGGSWAPHVASGSAKVIFATSYDRLKLAPNLVAMKDLGYSMGSTSYLTLSMAKDTPPDVLKKVSASISKAIQDPKMKNSAISRNMDPTYHDIAGTAMLIQVESSAFAEMLKSQN
tara:strand:+ start:51 stop:989 length:939 start_codon:yes stop_codon:yes gene_type:complete